MKGLVNTASGFAAWDNDVWVEANRRLGVRKRASITPEEWQQAINEAEIDNEPGVANCIRHIWLIQTEVHLSGDNK